MPRKPAFMRCIYCKHQKPRPRRGEHIILAGLGGRATISDVCAECNARLGRDVDEEFLRNTYIAIWRFLEPTVMDGQASAPQFMRSQFGTLDIQLLNSGHLDLLPQIVLHEDRIAVIAAEPDQELVNSILLAFPAAQPDIHLSIADVAQHIPPRLVLKRSGKKHLLRAQTSAHADVLLGELRKGIPVAPFSTWEPPGEPVPFRFSMDVNIPGRCAAKMALNMACAVLGPACVLESSFDDVRKFILGDNVLEGSVVGEDGEPGLRIDHRFVDPWMKRLDRTRERLPKNDHSIKLGEIRGKLGARVDLIGGTEPFTVRLAPFRSDFSERLPIALWTRADADWWLPFRTPERSWKHGERVPDGVGFG